jgi:osmotically-inducible protein OsmY
MHSQTDRKSLASYEIIQAARDRLRSNPYRNIRQVSCECNDQGVLFLRGRLPTFYHKQLAQEAVASLPGVTQVVNKTEVAV